MDHQELRASSFSKLKARMSEFEVAELMGQPDTAKELVVPDGSGVLNQAAMWIKIDPGEPFLEWVYRAKATDLTIWFARVNDSWRVARTVPIPRFDDG